MLLAGAAVAATWLTIGPEGNGPGPTCDELYHLVMGKRLVLLLRAEGLSFFRPTNIERNFVWPPDGPPVQAPLGHWLLGGVHFLFDPAPDDLNSLSLSAARFAPAAAFAVLVFFVGWWTADAAGIFSGVVAAAATMFMPRLFAHAHFAALDMFTTLFCVAAVLSAAWAARGDRLWRFALAGGCWGLALLVRLHGVLLAPPLGLWLFLRTLFSTANVKSFPLMRRLFRAWAAVSVWFVCGAGVFFGGWPWLWLMPLKRTAQYLSSGIERQPLNVFYWGRVWADRDVPWHYPWLMFLATVPLLMLVLGFLGLWAGVVKRQGQLATKAPRRSAAADSSSTCPNGLGWEESLLLLGTVVFILAVFSWPGTPVYDGVRLFLMVFPLWAVIAGGGAAWLERVITPWCIFLAASFSRHSQPQTFSTFLPKAFLALLFVLQGAVLVMYHPYQTSYYNLLVGGLFGAQRLGFEVTYWGDAVREPLLAEAARRAPNEKVLFAPNLAPFQAPAVEAFSPALHQGGVRLVGWDPRQPEAAKGCRWAIVYHRRADLAAAEPLLRRGRVVCEYRLQGVWLTRLLALDANVEQ